MPAKRFLIGLILPFSLLPLAAQESPKPEKWKDFISKLQSSMGPVDGLAELSVPFLKPGKIVAKWGKPVLERSKNGGYWILYSNPDPKKPFERISILASPDPIPIPIPTLASVPAEEVADIVDGELGVVKKQQPGKSLAL